MGEAITSFVGLDAHIDSYALAVAPLGREEPHFLGTVAPKWESLHKTLKRLGRSQELQIVCPCGYALARQLRAHGYPCEVIAPAKRLAASGIASRPIGAMRCCSPAPRGPGNS